MPDPSLEDLLSDQGRFMRTLAREVVGDQHLAEDVVQEVWLRGCGATLHPATAPAWWRTVIGNLGKSLRLSNDARHWRERTAARSERLPSAVDELERTELHTRVAQAVHALPKPYRAAVLMRFWDGLPPREIARQQGLPVSTVKSHLQRGLRRLREALEDNQGRPPRGLVALALPAPKSPLLLQLLLMQTNLKTGLAALVIGFLGVWGWTHRSALPPARSELTPQPVERPADLVGIVAGKPEAASDSTSTRAPVRVAVETPIATGVHVTGRVLDAEGNPLSGAVFVLEPSAQDSSYLRTTTNQEGRYSIVGVAPGGCRLEIEAPGYVPLEGRLILPDVEQHAVRDLVLVAGRTVSAWIVDDQNAPVSGAEVFLLEQPLPLDAVRMRSLGRSHIDGSFKHVGLPAPACKLAVVAHGLVPALVEVPSQGAEPRQALTVQLDRGWKARVRVQGWEHAAGDLRLSAFPANGSALADDEFAWVVHSRHHWALDAQAQASLPGLALNEPYYIQLEELGTDARWRVCAEVAPISAAKPEVALIYQPLARLGLTARDALTGAPVTGFELLRKGPGVQWQPISRVSRPDSPTVAAFEIDATQEFELRIEAEGYASAPVPPYNCQPGERCTLPTIALQPTRALYVHVYDAVTQAPLSAVRLAVLENPAADPALWRQAARTDTKGRARITSGPATTTEMLVGHPGYCAQRIPLADAPDPLRVYLIPGARAHVRVMDKHGTPVPRIRVACDAPSLTPLESAASDIEGRVLFAGLPAGEHMFTAVNPELISRRIMMGGSVVQMTLTGDDAVQHSTSAIFLPGEAKFADLIVPARLTLAGRVVAAGVPMPGVGLHILERKVGLETITAFVGLGEAVTATDAYGRFEFPAVALGDVTLIATHPERRFPFVVQLTLEEPIRDLLVDLPTSSLSGLVKDALDKPIPGALVRVMVSGPDGSYMQGPPVRTFDAAGNLSMGGDTPGEHFTTDSEGRYHIANAPPGYVLRVEASAPGGIADLQEAKLGPTEDRTLDFTLAPAGSLQVQLATLGGTPPRNCFVKLTWRGAGEASTHEKYLGLPASNTFDGLRPGPWEVEASTFQSEAEPTRQLCDVRAGETTQATLTVAP